MAATNDLSDALDKVYVKLQEKDARQSNMLELLKELFSDQ